MSENSQLPAVLEPEVRVRKDSRILTCVVDGQEFEIPKPFLSMHSPLWKARFDENPELVVAELTGDAGTFQMFTEFLQGVDGPNSEVSPENVLSLLHWGLEFDVDYIAAQCESFLLMRPPAGIEPTELLEIAARHNMPLLYARATEVVAQGMHWVHVPEFADRSPALDTFNVGGIREDLLSAHISMGLMQNDGTMNRRHRLADHTSLDAPKQRARLLWKTRKRFVSPPAEPKEHDWRALQTVWPHHSLRGDDWTVVPYETQPTMPTRARGII